MCVRRGEQLGLVVLIMIVLVGVVMVTTTN